jgi:hypothetical protein
MGTGATDAVARRFQIPIRTTYVEETHNVGYYQSRSY